MRKHLRRFAAGLLSAAFLSTPAVQAWAQTGKWVTAYYGSYFWDVPDYQAPQDVDMSTMTHLVFARIGPGGGWCSGGAPGEIRPGGGTAQNDPRVGPGAPHKTVEQYLIDRAQAAGVKALIMLGGACDEAGFQASTAPGVRQDFVRNLVDFMVARRYDGIDVDWERADSPADQAALEALLTELRAEANSRPFYQDRPFIMTFPAGMLNMNIDHVSAHNVRVAALVDQFNIMSYGTGWFGSGWHSSVFAAVTGHTPQRPMDIASTVQAYVDAGIPRSKIGMGIGFYGMNYKPPFTAPGQPTDGYDMSYWETNDVIWNYSMLHKHGYLAHGDYVWDAATQTSYRSYPGGYEPPGRAAAGYISYEDPASIAAKGAWARSTAPGQGVAGTIVWLLNYGTTDGHNNPLMDAVKQAFLSTDPGPNPPPPPPPPPPEQPQISSAVTVNSDWGSGYCSTVRVTNDGTAAAVWDVSFPFHDVISSSWNGLFSAAAGALNVRGQDWNRVVYPGQPREAGFCANRPAPPPPPPPPAPDPAVVSATVTVTSDWATGYCAAVSVHNKGAGTAVNWSVTLPVQGLITTLWNGRHTQTGNSLSLSGPDWRRDLAPGALVDNIGFCANR